MSTSNLEEDPPQSFYCPISRQIMHDPVRRIEENFIEHINLHSFVTSSSKYFHLYFFAFLCVSFFFFFFL
jgi:hypothetical protein